MADATRPRPAARWLYQLLILWLFLRFASGAFLPGGDWPLPPAHYVAMGTDLLLLLAVVGIGLKLFRSPDDPRSASASLLLAVGVVSGLGLLGIRFTSEAAWWTGHFRNYTFF